MVAGGVSYHQARGTEIPRPEVMFVVKEADSGHDRWGAIISPGQRRPDTHARICGFGQNVKGNPLVFRFSLIFVHKIQYKIIKIMQISHFRTK